MNSLPGGTVTFLMTDVEQSTRLTDQFPEPMRAALARHDALAQEAAAARGGVLVKPRGEGDSLFMVFTQATDAVMAAVDFHNALLAEPWDMPASLRVRMALHTGEADLRDGDYYGAVPNRCARIRGVAHGGQVLVSQTTSDLTRELLPPDVTLRDLGLHGLQDLRHPERLCQLLCPTWRDDFPPLRSLEVYRHNLPRQLTSFIGREDEMAQVKTLLAKTCLLTLVGSGGSGKTRLSLQVGADVVDAYADGVWLVELAPFSDPDLIAREVVKTLACREEPGRHALHTLCDYLKPKSLLLILDNCEHLLEEAAQTANTLLKACPDLRVLATSRVRLNVPGEIAWRIPSLLVPDTDARPDVDAALRYASLRLFAERAASARPQFAVTAANLPAVMQICRRLDGIPLAIELAAARVNSLSVQQIAQRLDDVFRLLVGGSHTVLERHQTLRALIDWSHDLLSARERVLLRRLAVFAGGWTLEGAEAVCAWAGIESDDEIEPDDVLELLSGLVETSLVVAEEQQDAQRYHLLETVRQYGQEKLRTAQEDTSARESHLRYFLALAEEAEPHLTGAQQSAWLHTLETEHDNLRAALAWAVTGETRLRLAGALWRFWATRYIAEGRGWLQGALANGQDASADVRAKALNALGVLTLRQAEYPTALALFTECLALRQQSGQAQGIAEAHNNLGNVAHSQGEYRQALVHYEKSLAYRQAAQDRWGIAASLSNMGMVMRHLDDLPQARAYYHQSLELWRDLQDTANIAGTLSNLGMLLDDLKEYEKARALFVESLEMYRQQGNSWGVAITMNNLASVSYHLEGCAPAHPLFVESLRLLTALGDKTYFVYALAGLAKIAGDRGEWNKAVNIVSFLVAQCRALGVPVPASEQKLCAVISQQAREHLTAQRFDDDWREGETLHIEQLF